MDTVGLTDMDPSDKKQDFADSSVNHWAPLPNDERPRHPLGFTLIELMIVIFILSTLSAIAVPSFFRYREKAQVARAQADIDRIHKAILLLELDTGQWPGHQPPNMVGGGSGNEIVNLNILSAGLCGPNGAPNWAGPYINCPIPKDPWGNHYFFDTDYNVSGVMRVVVGSYGPNGQGLNQYDSDDVIKILF
jgi:general secretion pathway protein G